MPIEDRRRGVVVASAGNHGLGIAYAARTLGMRARVYVPATAPLVKRDGIVAMGAEVDATQPDYDAAHDAALACAERDGMIYVSPCTGRSLLAGQGTVGLEILEDCPTVRTLVVPVGGGGLAGGIAVLVRAVAPHVRIVGAQSELTNAMAASLVNGRRTTIPVVRTLADGLAGQVDDEGVLIGRFALDEIVVVTEREIAESMRWLARMHGARVEGSGAVGGRSIAVARRMGRSGDGDRKRRQRRSKRLERDRRRAGRRRVDHIPPEVPNGTPELLRRAVSAYSRRSSADRPSE
jgi:threonine dehydratase